MADEVIITYDNLRRYHTKLLDLIPDNQIWRGDGEPPTDTDHILAVNTLQNLLYYKNELGGWTPISGGGGGGGTIGNVDFSVTNTSGWYSKTIAYGAKCKIGFNWHCIKDEVEQGDGFVKIIIDGTVEKSYSEEQGDIEVDVTEFLKEGINDGIEIIISDKFGNAEPYRFTITVVKVSIYSYFDEGKTAPAFKPHQGAFIYSYYPVGDVAKKVYFRLDGQSEEEALFQETTANNEQVNFEIPAQTHGNHRLEVYFWCNIGGTDVKSDSLVYDLICIEEGNETPIIVSAFSQDTARQHSTLPIKWLAYTPRLTTTEVTITDNFGYKDTLTVGQGVQTLSYRTANYNTEGTETQISFSVGGVVKKTLSFFVSQYIITPAQTQNLELYLSSKGRDNGKDDRGKWSYGSINASLTDFNFVSDGWITDEKGDKALRVTGKARVYIPFNIFGGDLTSSGKTIEFDFATRDILNPNATVIECWSNDKGIKITAQEALLKSELSEVSRQYKEDEHIRVSFVIEPNNENRLLSLYINGVESACMQYGSQDNFSQSSPVGIYIGSDFCTTDIYCIRVYSSKLSRRAVLNNWIADTQNIDELVERADRNDVFVGSDIDFGLIRDKNIPCFVVYAENYEYLPDSKGKKKPIDGEYVDLLRPKKNFAFTDAEIDVQGTSSQWYERKNYKIEFQNGITENGNKKSKYQLRSTSIPTNTFTFKTDFASSEGANNVELAMLYDEINPERTPPQLIDSRVRQGIEGYPCIMFYYDGKKYHFIGKYNFNNDKGTAEVFGFGEGDQSWEILNNNDPTGLGAWKDADYSDEKWKAAFEARYPEDSTNVTKLQEFAEWLVSTDTEAVDSAEEKQARIEKFRNEFGNYANVNAMIFNYVFTEAFLMVDNRRKNAFPTRYDADGKWIILPYDFDTAIGINNNGKLTFGYWLEDTDEINDNFVFNGQDSVLYVNMRLAFPEEIKAMYQELRKNPAFSYDAIEERFAKHQEVWGEAVFNEDSRFKYVEPLINKGIDDLEMLQGSKASQRKWWLYNRFRYLDSKYNTADCRNDYISFYAYAKYDIDVTPYADIYASAEFDSRYSPARALRGDGETPKPCTIENPTYTVEGEPAQDQVVAIFSASQLADIGDLSPMKIGRADFHMGVKLNRLKIGDGAEGYENPNLDTLAIGNLPLLTSLDIRNCTAFDKVTDVSGCPNIETVLAEGSKTTMVALPNGGVLKTLHLPATVTNLTIRNQPFLSDFSIANNNFSNISTLRLEGVDYDLFDFVSILNQIKANSRVRLMGIEMNIETAEEIFALYDKFDTFLGLDEADGTLPKAVIGGTINCGAITFAEYTEMEGRYPDITINYESLTATVKFYNEDNLLTERDVVIGTNGVLSGARVIDPIDDGTEDSIETPTKAEEDVKKFVFVGWDNDLKNIVADTDVKAKYSEHYKHKVTFYDDKGNIIQVNGKNTNDYFNLEGENAVVFPESLENYHFTDEDTGISYMMYFQGWRDVSSKEDVFPRFSIDDNDNKYTEINIEGWFKDSRVYVIRFIDSPVPSILSEQLLEEGKTITIPTPSRWESANGQYYHNFIGWTTDVGGNLNGENIVTPESVVGTSDLTYYAVYDSELRYYDIVFLDWEGNEYLRQNLGWGTTITAPDIPREGHTFTHWIPSFNNVVSGYAEYKAEYSINYYDVQFKYLNENGTWVTSPVERVEYNDTPTIPSIPTTPQTVDTTYTHRGWDIAPTEPITDDTIITAQYKSETRRYTITWKAGNNGTQQTYPYGSEPSIPSDFGIGKKITVDGVEKAIVTYGSIEKVTGDRTYTARVRGMATITGQIWDGTKILNDADYNGSTISGKSSTGFTVEKDFLTTSVYHAYRNIKINTEKIVGYKTSNQNIKVNFNCKSDGAGKSSNKVGMNPGSILIAGISRPKVSVDDSATSITLTLDSSTQSSLVDDKNGFAEVYFGLYHPTFLYTQAVFSNITFDITYHTQD